MSDTGEWAISTVCSKYTYVFQKTSNFILRFGLFFNTHWFRSLITELLRNSCQGEDFQKVSLLACLRANISFSLKHLWMAECWTGLHPQSYVKFSCTAILIFVCLLCIQCYVLAKSECTKSWFANILQAVASPFVLFTFHRGICVGVCTPVTSKLSLLHSTEAMRSMVSNIGSCLLTCPSYTLYFSKQDIKYFIWKKQIVCEQSSNSSILTISNQVTTKTGSCHFCYSSLPWSSLPD